MKKRIGNDIQFTWHIYRKSGETQAPESFDGKEVEVKLLSPFQQPVTIEDVSIATGVVTFTFRGKHQVTLGNYVAVLQENKGEDGMVTLDVVDAVTLVAHSYMEEDGDEGDVIEAESVELTSTISAGGGGGFVQQQADWAQTDVNAVNFILNKPNLDLFARLDASNEHEQNTFDTYKQLYGGEQELRRTFIGGGGLLLRVGRSQPVWFEYEDAKKLENLPTATELAEELEGKYDKVGGVTIADRQVLASSEDGLEKTSVSPNEVQFEELNGTQSAEIWLNGGYLRLNDKYHTNPTGNKIATDLELEGKQDKMLVIQVASGTSAIIAAVNTYYEVAGEVGTLAITLPTPTDLTKVSMVVVHLTAGTTPNIVIDSTETIDYSAAYDVSASKEYEINCLYNGDKWVVADMEVV